MVKVSNNKNLIIRCERMSDATGVGSFDERWIRPSRGGLGKSQNKTDNRIVPRRRKNSRCSRWNLSRDRDRSIQRIIPRRK
jgi:hypothetical protein